MQFSLNHLLSLEWMELTGINTSENGGDFKGYPDSDPLCAVTSPSPTQLLLLGVPGAPAVMNR